MKLNNKFAIGCLVQWYEIEIFEEYFESLKGALKDIDNKEPSNITPNPNISTPPTPQDSTSTSIPNLINGISQQPAEIRLPSQAERQINGLSSVARGLEKTKLANPEPCKPTTDLALLNILT